MCAEINLSLNEQMYLLENLYRDGVRGHAITRDDIKKEIVGFKFLGEKLESINPRVVRGAKELSDKHYKEIAATIINHPDLGSEVLRAMLAGERVKILGSEVLRAMLAGERVKIPRRQADQLLH